MPVKISDVYVVENNAKFPPGIEFEMPYNEAHIWDGGDFCGVSLQSWCSIMTSCRLVACNETGINAFFVKDAFASKFADVPTHIEALFRPGDTYSFPMSRNPTAPESVRYLASVTATSADQKALAR